VRVRANRFRRLAMLVPFVAMIWGTGTALATVREPLRTVVYHGFSVTVPRSWPVYYLARNPQTCVRFNRHALYLGLPSSQQSCPAAAVGRTEAILIEPAHGLAARTGAAGDPAGSVAGSATTFGVPGAGIDVTATWSSDPGLVAAALHRRTLPEARALLPPHLEKARSSGGAAAASTPVAYTGPGFDACYAPSAQKMSAWTAHSPYHAIGIYIGGANAACPPSNDPNLTPAWENTETAAGWHLIPTYVGLQAPSNSCGCSGIKSSQAAAEGTAAADDAVVQAQSLELPSGSPIYDDMEYYSRTQANTSAVLAFLAAWTTELHAKGYLSGVYGNANSVAADLATQYGTSYPEPDDIWFAAWPGNGSTSTSDPSIPSSDWANHQRLHQYSGAHNETYGGVTINIDGDYLDGATAGNVAVVPAPPPSLSVFPWFGTTYLTTSWSGLGLNGWQVLAGTSPTALTSVLTTSLQGAQTKIPVLSAAPYFAVDAMGSSGQVLATSATVAAPPRLMLFGHSTFFGLSSGVGGFPVGCYLASACQLAATLSVGGTTIARTAQQAFRVGGTGIVYYRLTSAGWKLLARAHGGHLPITITIKDASGASASTHMTLIPFTTAGRGPGRSVTASLFVTATGTTEPVHGWSGGILTRCSAVSACEVTPALTVGRVTIATAKQQSVGGLEVGYLYFWLTARGHQLLRQAPGNQLAVNLVLRSATGVASARIVLVQFS
jgi:Rv2525c-like, glycoside hydrolase-like domain